MSIQNQIDKINCLLAKKGRLIRSGGYLCYESNTTLVTFLKGLKREHLKEFLNGFYLSLFLSKGG